MYVINLNARDSEILWCTSAYPTRAGRRYIIILTHRNNMCSWNYRNELATGARLVSSFIISGLKNTFTCSILSIEKIPGGGGLTGRQSRFFLKATNIIGYLYTRYASTHYIYSKLWPYKFSTLKCLNLSLYWLPNLWSSQN